MISVKLSGRPGGPYAPLLVGDTGMPLVEQCHYIESAFGGLLAHPELYPSPQNCEEVQYSLKGEDGTDLLADDCPIAASVSEEDVARLQKGLAALRAMQSGALTTQRATVEAFRLPNFQRHRKFYRQCTDPSTGEKRLVVIWGIGVRDELGQVLDNGPILNASRGALVALLPPIAATQDISAIDIHPEDVSGVSTMVLNATPTQGTGPSKCKCWTVATVFLLVLALLAGLFYWWANRQYTTLAAGQKALADSLAVVRDRVDVVGTKLDDTARTLAAGLDAAGKKLDETATALTARLNATDKKLDELAGGLTTRLDAVEKQLDELARTASESAAKVSSLQMQTEMLRTDLGILDGKLAGVHQNVETGAGGLSEMRRKLVEQGGAIDGISGDMKRVFEATKLGEPQTPGLIDTLREKLPRSIPGSLLTPLAEGIRGKVEDENKKPTTPKREEVAQAVADPIRDSDRLIEFPPNTLPPGVIPPKHESELLDESKWAVPPGVKSFQAPGFYVDGKGDKEPFSYTYKGRGGVAGPPMPETARTEYRPLNPADQEKLISEPGKPPKLKEGAAPGTAVDVAEIKYGKDGQPIDSRNIRITAGGDTFELPLRTTWKKLSGDVDVPGEYVGDNPPPARQPVGEVKVNVYDITVIDRNGKVVVHNPEVKQAYQPEPAPEKK